MITLTATIQEARAMGAAMSALHFESATSRCLACAMGNRRWQDYGFQSDYHQIEQAKVYAV